MSKSLKILYRAAAALCVAFYLLCGFWSRFGISQLWIWPAAAVVCLICSFTGFLGKVRPLRYVWRGCVCLGLAALIALIGAVGIHMGDQLPEGLSYVIVLGARVEEDGLPSLSLRHRLETAEAYLSANPDTVAVVSGGKGSNEPVSEAQCMAEWLIGKGISANRIILEDASSDTRENFTNCRALIPDEDASVGFITNNFHVARALTLAEECGFREIHAGAASFVGPLLIHYIVREALGLVAERVLG